MRKKSLLCAISCTLALTACDERTTGRTDGYITKPANAVEYGVPLGDGKKYSEPGLRGKIVDAVTKKPIEGAMVYGYYATQKGGVGGGKQLVEMVRSFEAASDANGVFELPMWDTGDKPVKGEAMSLFPLLAIYKPGYDFWHNNFVSIRQYSPKTSVEGPDYELKDNVYDWTKQPHELTPVTSERDRYSALNDSSVGLQFIGECGWEAYSKTLLARHNEWKRILKETFPKEELDSEGYSLGRYNHPDRALRAAQSERTTLDELTKRNKRGGANWKCANPENILGLKK
jgi:hypothetical protein